MPKPSRSIQPREGDFGKQTNNDNIKINSHNILDLDV